MTPSEKLFFRVCTDLGLKSNGINGKEKVLLLIILSTYGRYTQHKFISAKVTNTALKIKNNQLEAKLPNQETTSLLFLINYYLGHLEHHVKQIVAP